MTVVQNYEYYIDANVSLIHVGISTNEILPNRQNLDFVIKCKTKFCRIGRISKYWDMPREKNGIHYLIIFGMVGPAVRTPSIV